MNNLFTIIDTLSAVRFKSVDVNAKTIVKGGAYYVNVVIRLLPMIGLSVTGPRVRAIVIIFRKFSFLASTQGIRGLVIHCKACGVLLAQAIGGHTIKDSGQLNCRVSRTNKGIPRFILASDRMRLRAGDKAIFKFYQTVFSLLRILSFKGKPELSTITAPFSGNLSFITNELFPLIPPFVSAILKLSKAPFAWEGGVTWVGITKVITPRRPAVMQWLLDRYADLHPLWLAKSAAGTHHEGIEVSSHPFLMIRTVRTILSSDVAGNFRYFLNLLPVNAPFQKAFDACAKAGVWFKPLYTLGKLGIKEEAAGKVRLFAMAPTWFQLFMEPIHAMIFLILKGVPQDGTFNQLGPLRDHTRYSSAFSLDLKAATDRLPLVLQVEILARLTGSDALARNWGELLTKIDYIVRSMEYGLNHIVRYIVGQPMGALSSWPMLALTHHFLVQASAWRSGVTPVGTWFTGYAILGDDVVIFNEKVAIEYRRLISHIGMSIGLHKSILSKDGSVIEFAKRIFWHGEDVSPVPFKEFFASLFGFGNFLDLGRKYNLSFVQLARVLGFKYRALSKLGHGFKLWPSRLKQLYVASNLPGVSSEVEPFLQLGKPIKAKWPVSLELFWKQFTQSELRQLLFSIDKRITNAMNDIKLFINLGDFVKDPLLAISISKVAMSKNDPSFLEAIQWKQPVNDVVESPSEAKEIGLGFTMLAKPDDKILIPSRFRDGRILSDRDLLDELPERELPQYLSLEALKDIRWALACLFDAHILPKRTSVLEALDEVRRLAVSQLSIRPEDMNEVFINFLHVSREVSATPNKVVSFTRLAASSRSVDPISLRLWRKWGKLIQGSVHSGSIPK